MFQNPDGKETFHHVYFIFLLGLKKGKRAFHANSALATMLNIPKACQPFCKKCGKYQPHKMTQCKRGKDSLYALGKWCYDRK